MRSSPSGTCMPPRSEFVTDTGRMVVKENGKVVADVPADSLTEAPIYHPAKSEASDP